MFTVCASLSQCARVHFTRMTTTYDFDDLMLNFVRMNALENEKERALARSLACVCVGYSLNRSPVSVQHAACIYILNVYISVYIKTHIPAAYITICIHNTATCAHTISL